MIQFIDPGTDLAAALRGSYDVGLVGLSYVIAALAAYAGFLLSERIVVAGSWRARWTWIAAGSVAMGVGVWTMHFIGMLAYRLPIPITYDFAITVSSVVPAILASALALDVMSRGQRGHGHLLARGTILGGTLMGAGIGVMHYSGMLGMCVSGDVRYDPALFALSIVVAVVLGIAALYAHSLRSLVRGPAALGYVRPLGAALMGLAITGMHYTAMAATNVFPNAAASGDTPADTLWLSAGVTIVATLIALLAIVATVVDRRLQQSAELVEVTRQRMVEAIESITDGFVLFDNAGKLVMCNGVFRQMYPELSEVLKPGTPYEQVVAAWVKHRRQLPDNVSNDHYVRDCVKRFKDGGAFTDDAEEDQLQDGRWIYIRQRPVAGGGLVGVWTDVTPIKNLQAVYEMQASHDALTGLANRKLFEDRIVLAAAHSKRLKLSFALLYIDLDGFKPINDRLGHDAGDAVLKEVARRLKTAARETDTVARVGGDEFAIVMAPGVDRPGAERLAARALQALAEPIDVGTERCIIGASIGVVINDAGDGFDKDALVKAADRAMYEAKKSGGNAFRILAA